MRTYRVEGWSFSSGERKGKSSKFTVTDRYEAETEEERPYVAIFPVNVLYDAETQEVRANKLAAYLNDVNSKISMFATLSGSTMGN